MFLWIQPESGSIGNPKFADPATRQNPEFEDRDLIRMIRPDPIFQSQWIWLGYGYIQSFMIWFRSRSDQIWTFWIQCTPTKKQMSKTHNKVGNTTSKLTTHRDRWQQTSHKPAFHLLSADSWHLPTLLLQTDRPQYYCNNWHLGVT